MLSDISKSKGNQKTEFDQLIEYNVKNHAENETGRLVPDLFLFSKKGSSDIKVSGQHLKVSIYFGSPRVGHTIKTNCMKLQAADSEIYSILIL